MTTYSEKPLRILGLTVLLSISEHMVHFCPQKVYKRYTSSIHQGTLRRKYAKKTTLHLTVVRRDLAHNMNGEPSKGTALQATADAVVEQLHLEAEIIREGSDEPLCKKRRLLNNKMKVALAEGTRAQAENIRALVEICRESMQLV